MLQTNVTLPANSTSIFVDAASRNFQGFVNPATFGRSTVETLAPSKGITTGVAASREFKQILQRP